MFLVFYWMGAWFFHTIHFYFPHIPKREWGWRLTDSLYYVPCPELNTVSYLVCLYNDTALCNSLWFVLPPVIACLLTVETGDCP